MDAVGAMLDDHRARGAFLLRCVMAPPWSVRIADRSAVALVVMLRGGAWVVPAAGAAVHVGPGDVAIVKGAEPYVLADDPATPPTLVVEPGQVCRPLDVPGAPPAEDGDPSNLGDGDPSDPGDDAAPDLDVPPRTWGNDPHGPTAFVVGVYELPGQVSGRLLEAVPDLVVVRGAEVDLPAARLLTEEFEHVGPGQDVVLDRLVDLVLITSLRTWLTTSGAQAPPWWRAEQDVVVGPALRLIHDHPERPWTLVTLAAAVAVSRATLARRFTVLLGQPPMAYLTEWRLAVAADLLGDTTDTVERIAHRVGYANAFAFSTAFKRRYGHPPRHHRRARPA